MIIIGTNTEENESLYRCSECRRILTSGETCCHGAPYWPELEEKANKESTEYRREARHDGDHK